MFVQFLLSTIPAFKDITKFLQGRVHTRSIKFNLEINFRTIISSTKFAGCMKISVTISLSKKQTTIRYKDANSQLIFACQGSTLNLAIEHDESDISLHIFEDCNHNKRSSESIIINMRNFVLLSESAQKPQTIHIPSHLNLNP